MSTERRFSEAEIATILERATAKYERTQLAAGNQGLTLAQLQDVGREVGIEPSVVAEMAGTLDDKTVTRYTFGLPMGVERAITLPRPLSDEDWVQVVVNLRELFGARGVMRGEGSLRQWTNGNLQALLEPTAAGQRIRVRTFKGNASPMLVIGLSFFAVGAGGIVAFALTGPFVLGRVFMLALLGATGLGIFASTALGVRSWAKRRREQMAELAARITTIGRQQ